MLGESDPSIWDVAIDRPIYVGADPASGHLNLLRALDHPPVRNRMLWIGPAATLALGLTECCANFGRGKVFYYFQDQASAPDILDGIHPADSIPFLEIFYTDYEWTPQSRANWLRSPHYERLYRLNIRREPSLPTGSQMMPVTICYHSDDSQNIEIRKGSGTAVLCYGTDGAMYIGLLADLTKTAQICHGDNVYNIHGRGWIASKGNLTQFQMHSGLQAAQVLHAMYAAGHPKMFQNATIMKTCAARIMLYEISIEAQRWRQNVEKALKDYTHAAKENIMVAVSSFVNEDENWATLSLDEKRLVCRIWELKYEALGYHDVTFKVNLDASEP